MEEAVGVCGRTHGMERRWINEFQGLFLWKSDWFRFDGLGTGDVFWDFKVLGDFGCFGRSSVIIAFRFLLKEIFNPMLIWRRLFLLFLLFLGHFLVFGNLALI